jgi:PAP2 superfamily
VRLAESINFAFFFFLSLAPWVLSLSRERCFRAAALGVTGIALTATGLLASQFIAPPTANLIRDWLPAALIVLAYRQAGLSAARTNVRVQARLLRFDEALLQSLGRLPKRTNHYLSIYLEFAYLFCYPMVPLGVSVLYLIGMRAYADHFWTVVLPPTYICYATLPFLQLMPPWMAKPDERPSVRGNPLRTFNFWIVNHLSIRTDTFPSAHVAASFATAVALFAVAPRTGIAFFCLAVSIAIASVVQRYHYAVDALLGVTVVVVTCLLQTPMVAVWNFLHHWFPCAH